MLSRRTLAMSGVLVALTALVSSVLAGPPPRPAPQTDAPPVFDTGQGIRDAALRGWPLVLFEGGITGSYDELLLAPLCAELAAPGCRADAKDDQRSVGLFVERADSQATAPGDELPALLVQAGYTQEAATVDGHAATRFTGSDSALRYYQVYVLEVEGVYYHIAFSQGFRALPVAVGQILDAAELLPDEAPAPFISDTAPPAATATVTPPAATPTATAGPAPQTGWSLYLPLVAEAAARSQQPQARFEGAQVLGGSSFDLEQFYTLARYYGIWLGRGIPPNPVDNCYIYTDAGNNYAECLDPPSVGPVERDGAHFIDCMLKAAGLPGARCNRVSSYLTMVVLRDFLIGLGATDVTNGPKQPGDVVFLKVVSNGTYCWGGVVVGVSNGTVLAAGHSADRSGVNASSMYCLAENMKDIVPTTKEYLRIDSEAPYAWFTAPTPGAVLPGVQHLAYDASDPTTSSSASSGIADFTLSSTKDGVTTTFASNITERQYDATLDFPCRAIQLTVLARDLANNADPARAGHLDLFVQLRGDVDGNGVIDDADYDAIRDANGLKDGQAGYSAALDPTGDGLIDAADRLYVSDRKTNTCAQP